MIIEYNRFISINCICLSDSTTRDLYCTSVCTNLCNSTWINEPAHEIMALVVLRKLILQSRIRSHPVGPDVWFLVGLFVYFHSSFVRTAKALASLRGCAGSPEPLLVAYVISTIISWAGSNENLIKNLKYAIKLLPVQELHRQSLEFAS